MTLSARIHCLAALALASTLLLACGKTKIDHTKVEEAIKSGIKAQVKGGDVKTMTCPSGLEAKTGATFECKGQDADGTDLVIAVTVKDEEGNIAWKIASATPHPKAH